jgi:endonuclease/exonuclease/phosphatase family metal-dependent hydrolase
MKTPFGTPLVTSCSDDISISSFNLLAPLYIRPIDQRTGEVQPFAAFEWVKDDDLLRNETRLPRLLDCLQQCDTDFICVQELQLERRSEDHAQSQSTTTKQPFVLPSWIKPLIPKYQVILPPQEQLEKIAERNRRVLLADTAVTNAIFYKPDRWVSDDDIGDHTTTCITAAFRSVDEDTASIVISSIHLDASREEKRCAQIQRCLQQTLSFSNDSCPLPLIIAGDFNCELSSGSCVNAFMTNNNSTVNEDELKQNKMKECAASLRISETSVTAEHMKAWHSLYDEVAQYVFDNCWVLRRVQTGYTRMALDHDESRNDNNQLKPWKLDHFLYTSNTLNCAQFWSTLEDDDESTNSGLPNEKVPTDHLPLAANFKRQPHARLAEGLRQDLLDRLDALEARQDSETRDMNATIDQEKILLEEKLQTQAVIVETTPKKKKKPAPEMIAHIRQSRSLKKQLKQKQSEERKQFVSGRCVLERMELQHKLGITCNEWIEKGRSK